MIWKRVSLLVYLYQTCHAAQGAKKLSRSRLARGPASTLLDGTHRYWRRKIALSGFDSLDRWCQLSHIVIGPSYASRKLRAQPLTIGLCPIYADVGGDKVALNRSVAAEFLEKGRVSCTVAVCLNG